MRIDRVHTVFLAQPHIYSPPTNVAWLSCARCSPRKNGSSTKIIEMRLYHLWFHVELLNCWCCCGLFYDYVEHTEHWESPRKEGSCVDGAVPRHSIELALDISLAPTRLQGPCLFGRPARRHSRMRVQLMASDRHTIDSRDASLLPMPYGHVCSYNHMTRRPSRLYYLWFHVELLYCWCCCGLFYDYVERTEHW